MNHTTDIGSIRQLLHQLALAERSLPSLSKEETKAALALADKVIEAVPAMLDEIEELRSRQTISHTTPSTYNYGPSRP